MNKMLIIVSCFQKKTRAPYCLFHGNFFKAFSIVFPAPWLAKVESSQKSNGMWFFRHFFAPYLFHRSRSNRRDKLRSKVWREKMFGKPHLKLLRWCSVHGTNSVEVDDIGEDKKRHVLTPQQEILALWERSFSKCLENRNNDLISNRTPAEIITFHTE